ncbi:AA1R protein, partial [Polyodon spathula]|nr:adenosine receptor A1-like [Polyodon spathula]MBN3282563.1 AA1R protein [Polyodon spathula]
MAHGDDVVYIVIEVVIAFVSCLGNLLVIGAVRLNHSLREPTFLFVVSLAVADLAVGAAVIPLAIILIAGLETHFYACLFLSCVILILTQSSILSLLAIALDRYLRVKIPVRYRTVVTQRRAWGVVAACWLLSIMLGIIPMLGWNNKASPGNETVSSSCMNCTFLSVISMPYMVYLNFFGWVLVPLLLMICLYVEIFYRIRKQLNQNTGNSTESTRYYRKEQKLARSLALVLFLFAACWLPLHIMNSIQLFSPQTEVPLIAIYSGILLTHGNSAANPIVYAFRIKKFRDTYAQLWNKYFRWEEPGLPSSTTVERNSDAQVADSTVERSKTISAGSVYQ